jgi:hypothetical protein
MIDARLTLVLLAAILSAPVCQALDLDFKSNRELRREQDAATSAQEAQQSESDGPRPVVPADGGEGSIQKPTEPILDVELEGNEAVPGQSLALRMTVLVPTYLREPPTWPLLDAPNLLVRLPEGATAPTSRRVGGETWSGVTRQYRIAPLAPGTFRLPAAEVVVTYADPQSNDPVTERLPTEPLTLSGVLPAGAEGLDPFIAAESLELTQQVDGKPDAMAPGDSLVRTITATIRGAPPMLLPELIPPTAVDGITAYPDEPVLDERDARGQLGGTRTERVTLVAAGGGRGEAPPVSVRWYNLGSGEIETARLEGFEIRIQGPPARTGDPAGWSGTIPVGLLALIAALGALLLLRWIWPALLRWVRGRRADWHASERYAYARLRRIVAARDYTALHPALDAWSERVDAADPRLDPRLLQALFDLGAGRYQRDASTNSESAWRAFDNALVGICRDVQAGSPTTAELPPLNPTRSPAV